MTNSCYFFRKIRDMRPNNDARVDLMRRMIVLTGTRYTYFEFKTTHKTFCMVIYKITFVLYGNLLGRLEYKVQKNAWNWANTGSPLKQYVFMKIPIIELFELALDMLIWHLFFFVFSEIISSTWRQDPKSTWQSGHDFRSWRCCGDLFYN
jgi:hypothetical protein